MSKKLYTGANLGIVADWIKDRDGKTLSVVPDQETGEILQVNLNSIIPNQAEFLPAWNIKPGEEKEPGESIQNRRLELINQINKDEIEHLILPVRALGSSVLDPSVSTKLDLDIGQIISPSEINRNLRKLGYKREKLVESPGDYSLRGDLLDIYPRNTSFPIRISFFDDEIESIDYFNPNTHMQADEDPSTPISLQQYSEFALSPDERDQLAQNLGKKGYHKQSEKLEHKINPDEIANWYGFWPRPTTNPEDLIDASDVVFYRPAKCWEVSTEFNEQLNKTPSGPHEETFRNLEAPLLELRQRNYRCFTDHFQESPLTPDEGPDKYGSPIHVSSNPTGDPSPIDDFLELVLELIEDTDEIVIHCGEDGFRDRMEDLLDEKLSGSSRSTEANLDLRTTPWHGSFKLNGFARLSLDDFFNRTIRRGRVGPNRGQTEYLESFDELQAGDLVVHENFGIGRFQGLKRINTEKQTRDCLHIEYAGDDKLFLPPDQIAWVQKYIADSGYTPSLSNLSGGNWSRIRENIEEELNDLANELLELYTSRDDQQGHAFPPDDLEQKQFEASFPYRETPDQQEAIQAVKSDMQEPEPMDRLICGDSGFGKTEVALRAAFKAVSDNKQVAMLVPTTILARQHYETFSKRFSFFPKRVEMISRFQTKNETHDILKSTETGDVDVLVGTHRLLSDDVEFDNLGLLIIDEEQRFGVEQKESIKFYRNNVDVLTLSATPIPRTLYMTLSGIQDISRINTPPEDRVPIEIDVGPFNNSQAADAIDRELSRGGQVFWVYNKVSDIQERAEFVKSLHPDAEVGIAHGQMNKTKLRSTMDDFYDGQIDILVCTTIIENGIDCPTVNTMIIEDAHRYGLAQLYQLRGRVGRSHQQGYVKIFYPSNEKLTEDARSRLDAIEQCSNLGSGFKLAMRDLEIRGAGNILGKKQHGNIRAVGFPLYCRMLQREIRKLREEFEVPKPFPKLKLPGKHFIPESYIPSEKQRIRQYQELSSCREIDEVIELKNRWSETFGPIPDPVQNTLIRHQFKILADENGWDDFFYRGNRLGIRFADDPPELLIEAARKCDATPKVRSNRLLINHLKADRVHEWLREVTGLYRSSDESIAAEVP